MLHLRVRKVFQKIKESVATLGQLLVGVLLEVGELVRVGVHPVPDSFLQALHHHQVGILLQSSELRYRLGKKFGQPANVTQFRYSVIMV